MKNSETCEIKGKTTAAYSPWSNGLCERHNQTLTNIMQKVRADKEGMDFETLLCWALAAKNSMVNTHGFSPYQLVFGNIPNFPFTFTDELPALEGITRSKTVEEHVMVHVPSPTWSLTDAPFHSPPSNLFLTPPPHFNLPSLLCVACHSFVIGVALM